MTTTFRRALLDRATQPYRAAGHFAWHFARGKLKGDPAFFGLLEHGLIPDAGRLIDLGCGQGCSLPGCWKHARCMNPATGLRTGPPHPRWRTSGDWS